MLKLSKAEQIAQSGVGHTQDGTGILIFISVLERRVQLLADNGIAQKVDQNDGSR